MELYTRDRVICLKSNLPRLLHVRFQNRDAPVRYPYRIAGLARYIAAAFITICFLVTGTAQAGPAREVLVLNSYHPTYEWTKLAMNGIESTLQQYEDRIELDVEYMDTKYFYDERNYENLYALYKYKASRKQYDVIITSDNNALLFVLQHRDKLYPNVPVVFCGVDRFHGSMLESRPGAFDIDSVLQGHDDVTGVIESLDHESTVEIALKLHPSAKRVIIVHDGISETMYWPALSEKDLTKLIQRFGGRIEFVRLLLTEPNFDSLLKKIEGPAGESIVYLADTFRALGADLHFSKDELEKLRQRCTAPIYVLTERWFGYDLVVGGKINSGFHQGQAAAEMAMRILNGESARDIPILRQGPTRYMFDYIQLKRFGISLSDLPEGSIVINEPESFYYLYKRRIWTVITIVACLATVVMILSVNILRRKKAEEKLKQYQFMVESAHDAIFFKDLRSRYIIANNKTLEAFGLSREQIIGKNDYEIMPDKEEANGNIEDDQVVFQTGKLKEITKHMTGADGKERWFEAIKVPQFDGKGNAVGLIGIARDVTERKRAEESLSSALAWQEAVFEGSRDAVFISDADSRFVMVNRAACELTGYSKDDLVGMRIPDLHEEEDLTAYNMYHDRIMAGEEIVSEAKTLRKDGTKVDTEFNNRCIKISGTEYMHTVARDITERKRAEEALQLERDNLMNILDSMEDGVYIVDQNHDIQYVNPILKKDFGPFEERKCYEYFHDRDKVCPWCKNKEVFAGKTVRWEWYSFKNHRTYDLIDTPLRNPDGSISKLEIFRDITERKQAAEALRERTLELGKRVKEQNCLYDMAEILDTPEILLDDILQKTAAIIPPAFQYPEITSVRVILKGQEFRTENFRETSWKQSSDIIVSGEQIGSVEVCYLEKKPQMDEGPFLKEEISLLDAIAERLRRVIERREAEEKVLHYQAQLKSLASELSLAEERERHRIATELHDRISQSIVISKVKLEELRESTSSADLAKSIGEICNWLDETIQNTRLLTSDLSSPILYELGFEAAVSEWLAEQIQEKHGIATEFEDDEQPKPLDDDIRALLFRMVQELLINVVKHAQAHKVKVFSRKVNSEVHVSVEDDGVGFNPTETASMPTKTGGFGLFSIRERLEQLGGRLEIKSKPGHGCRVTVMVPLKQGKINDEGQE